MAAFLLPFFKTGYYKIQGASQEWVENKKDISWSFPGAVQKP